MFGSEQPQWAQNTSPSQLCKRNIIGTEPAKTDRPVSIGSTEFTARNFRNIRTRVSGQEGPRFYFTLVLSEVFIHRNLGSIHILYTLRMSDISFCLIADIPNM